MPKNKLKLTNAQLKKMWHEEITKRKEFGISSEVYYKNISGDIVRYCSLRTKGEFEYLFHLYTKFRKNNKFKLNRERLVIDSVKKYNQYTFFQLKNNGGALQLSQLCKFAYVIKSQKIQYEGCTIHFFHRKSSLSSKNYPSSVVDVFKKDTSCRAVAFLCKIPLTREVMIEKKHFYANENSKFKNFQY